MSGLGLLQLLKNRNCAVPVIIVTGKPSARSEAFYLAKLVLSASSRKPVDGDALVELIGSVPHPDCCKLRLAGYRLTRIVEDTDHLPPYVGNTPFRRCAISTMWRTTTTFRSRT